MSRSAAIVILLSAMLGSACSSVVGTTASPGSQVLNEQAAIDTLESFFLYIHDRRYEEATALYGGVYDVMRDWNPDIPADDLAGLMRRACTHNGIKCLRLRAVTGSRRVSPQEATFTVEFMNEDRSLFVRGPCCGASLTDEAPQSEFEITVRMDSEGVILVQDMPPYVP